MKDIDEWKLDALVPILALPHFNSTDMKITSVPAGNICEWVINVVRFNVIYKKVKPLQDAAAAA
jgi:dynein heavy chain